MHKVDAGRLTDLDYARQPEREHLEAAGTPRTIGKERDNERLARSGGQVTPVRFGTAHDRSIRVATERQTWNTQ